MSRAKPNSFHFKKFSVRHDRCTMKVGTDAVLVGAWADVGGAENILDIGAGSGVIALMLAQRTGAEVNIDAVEIANDDFDQATENFSGSPWAERLKIFHASIQTFNPTKQYDLIVSNPPYFINSSAPPSEPRKQVRHTSSLSYEELLAAVVRLLSQDGKFCVVLPTTEGLHFITLAADFGLFPSRQLAFFSRRRKPQERWLLEFQRAKQNTAHDALVLYDEKEMWSKEYAAMMKEFYL